MKKILCISLILIIFNLFFINYVQAKYVIEENYEIINIKSADNENPYINDRNYDVTDETFTEDVTVNYNDNLKIKYAKYWYNLYSNEFEGEGTDFDTGTVFSNDGWYKIEVSDMYDNITIYTFFIDQNFDSVEVICTEITDEGGTLQINATDLVSGVQKLELYIKDELYDTFIYDEWFVTEKTEIVNLDMDNLPFYEEIYVVATDFCDNTKTSESIMPNKNRIYDKEDLVKFQTVVNSDIDEFDNEIVYLLNDIDLSSVCSEELGNWEPINENFLGTFEGNNYTISNLYINTTSSYSGFFSTLSGTVQNLNLSGQIITSRRLYWRSCRIFI